MVEFLTVLCRIKYCSFENQWLSSNTSICGEFICGIKQLLDILVKFKLGIELQIWFLLYNRLDKFS